MQKKRLEEALNAGKLIRLGFDINLSKPEKLNLLYYVRCNNNQVVYANGEVKSNEELTEDLEIISNNNSTDSFNKNNKKIKKNTQTHNTNVFVMDEKIEILCLQFNQNLNLLATGDSDGHIKISDIFSGFPLDLNNDNLTEASESKFYKSIIQNSAKTKFQHSVTYNMPIICMKWFPDTSGSVNLLYYAHVNGYIGVLDKESMKKSLIIEESDEISCIDFSIDGTKLASVGKDYCIKLYDSNLNSSSLNKQIKSYGCQSFDPSESLIGSSDSTSIMHTSRLQSVKFSNMYNDVLFSGGWDRTVKMWDIRTKNGLVNTIHGPFICGSDAIDICNYLVLTASWVKENSLQLWDIRNCQKILSQLPIKSETEASHQSNYESISISSDESCENNSMANLRSEDNQRKNGEYLYACKFFASNNKHQSFTMKDTFKNTRSEKTNDYLTYSTVIACGSGTQSVHLIDYEASDKNKHLAAINCKSPLYCLDTIYSCSLVACGSMKKYFTFMTTSYSSN